MLYDLIDLSKLRRAILYALLFMALFFVQDHILAHVRLFGVRPLLIPAAVAAVGLFGGGVWGGLVGLLAGFFCDMGAADTTFLFTILLTVVGFFCGVLGQFLLRRGFFSYAALMVLTLALATLGQMFRFLFFTETDAAAVWRTGLWQFVWSLPWCLPIYFPCRSIAERS